VFLTYKFFLKRPKLTRFIYVRAQATVLKGAKHRKDIIRKYIKRYSICLVLMMANRTVTADLVMKPNRCRKSDGLLEELKFLKCDEWRWPQQTVWHRPNCRLFSKTR